MSSRGRTALALALTVTWFITGPSAQPQGAAPAVRHPNILWVSTIHALA